MAHTFTWPRLIGSLLVVSGSLFVFTTVNTVKNRMKAQAVAEAVTGGESALAPPIFRRYGCGGCHTIPGIAGADGKVAGGLEHLSQQVYVGGVVNNTGDNLVAWIVYPQQFSPRSAMPATGITQVEARHLAAYLYAH